jgi:transposase-like protein
MNCSRCGSVQVIKSGFNQGQQRYACKECHFHFITQHKRDFTDKKVRVVRLYCSGVSFRQIGRLENVSPTSVRRWVRQYAQDLPEIGVQTQTVSVVELDEQWHFLQKNAKALDLESGRL